LSNLHDGGVKYASMTDPVEIQRMLTAEVREALSELAGFRQKDIAARRRQRVKRQRSWK
jgi:hypothetical protein